MGCGFVLVCMCAVCVFMCAVLVFMCAVFVFMCAGLSHGVLFTVLSCLFFSYGELWLAVHVSLCVCLLTVQFICYV